MPDPGLRSLAGIFLRIGNLTFGGGDPTMAALQRELVERRGWLSAESHGLIYALARVTPGTNVLAYCAGAGWKTGGWPGAVVAVLAASLPSSIVAYLLIAGYQSMDAIPWARAAMSGVAASVAGMMAAGAILLLRPQWREGRRVRSAIVAAAALVLSHQFEWQPVPILAIAAAAGYFWEEQ